MSRALAGFGGGLGAIGGAVAGSYIGKTFHGRMTSGDAEDAGIALGAIFGAFFGAAVGAGPDPKQITVGTSGVGELRSEWKL